MIFFLNIIVIKLFKMVLNTSGIIVIVKTIRSHFETSLQPGATYMVSNISRAYI